MTRDNTETRNSIPNESGGIESEGGTKSSKVAGRGQLRDQTSIRRPSVLTQAIRPLATVFIAHYPVMFCMSEDDPERTPEEQAVIDEIADSRGEEFVEEHDELILDQARLVGEL